MNLQKVAEKISDLLDKSIKAQIIPGAGLTLLDEDEISISFRGKMGRRLCHVNSTTLYDLASLTKVVGTTSRLLQLIDEGKLGYETEISEIFPQYPNLRMSIGQVMLHRAGFIADFSDKQHFSEQMIWRYLADFQYRENQPMLYSDVDFLLLGLVIEKLDALDLEESFQKHIFQRLNMQHTSFFPPDPSLCAPTEYSAERGQIQGIVHDRKAFLLGKPAGHAGLFSSVEDISKFLLNFLEAGIFSKQRLKELKDTNFDGRSYGWAVYTKAGQLYHTGFTGGLICIDLNRGRALGLLSNSIYPSRSDKRFIAVRRLICDLFFSERKF